LDDILIEIDKQSGENETTYTVTIKSDKSYDYFPVALWDIPVKASKGNIICSNCRFVNAENKLEGSSHGVVIGAVKKGTTRWTVMVQGQRILVAPHLRNFDNIVGLKTIPNVGDIPYTYVWTELRDPTEIILEVPAGRNIWAEFYEGGRVQRPDWDNKLAFTLKQPRAFARVWNVRAEEVEVCNLDQIRLLAVKSLEKTLEVWPLDDVRAEYESALESARREIISGRSAGMSEGAVSRIVPLNMKYNNEVIARKWRDMLRQRRQWFREIKGIGPETEMVVEAHAYCNERVGAPWRDKADFHHVIDCAEAVNFEVVVYDYATCYEPGHSFWHMGRAFWMEFTGLDKYKDGKLELHFHAYDYDCLGRCYTVFFSAPRVADGMWVRYDRNGRGSWPVPQGRDKRDLPESILTVAVPDCFRDVGSFRVWLKEGYEAHNIDMRKQIPYSVAVSDVWVTCAAKS